MGKLITFFLFIIVVGIASNFVSKQPEIAIKITPTISSSSTTTPTETLKKELCTVTKVIDGDTIIVNIDGISETIRLIGIDSPEMVDPRKPVQCFGKEASNKAKDVLTGKHVSLEADGTQGERDKYNRLLRFVFLEDGTNFNELMISEGYAHEYTYQSNPYKYQEKFISAQTLAREQKKGLWADGVCITPTPIPTKLSIQTAAPAVQSAQSTIAPTTTSGNYLCTCSKTCTQIKTCDEAYFQLNSCGCKARDADGDGVPCESLCR